MPPRPCVIVNGPPASGKSTLAAGLAAATGWPLLEKDLFKETLFDSLGAGDREWSRRLGRASIALMYRVAAVLPVVILDSVFTPELARRDLARPVLEVFCRCPPALAERRFRERQASRHPGHVSGGVDFAAWADTAPVGLGPVLEVDTSEPVGIGAVVAWVRSAAGEA